MTLYFENLPVISYNFTDTNEVIKMKNIFYQLSIEIDFQKYTKFYRINGIMRIDTISQELYGSTDYWWVIALINNINDIIFDLPVDDNILRKIAMNKTTDIYDDIETVEAIEFYSYSLEKLEEDNNDKRLISVINPHQMGEVLTEIIKKL